MPSRRHLLKMALGAPFLSACSERTTATSAAPTAARVGDAHDATLDALHEEARAARETEVVIYTAFAGATALWDAFNQRFPGIKAVPAQAAAASLFTRLDAERRSGNRAGDLALTGFSDMAELVRQGLLVPEAPVTAQALPARFRAPGDTYQLPWLNVFTIAYNTTRTDEAQVPKSLADVLDPARRGQIVFPRLAGTSVSDVVLATLVNSGRLDDAQLRVLRDQSRQLDMGDLVSSVAQGRIPYSLWTPAQSIAILAAGGAPVKQVFPRDVAVLFGPGVGLLEQAPHPRAARLFKAWLFTAHGQQVIAKAQHSYGTMPGAPVPDHFPGLEHYAQADLPLADANRLLTEFRQRTRGIWGDA